MSGIEIAGLLLGAFPLLISALEHYRQSAEVLDDWWQIKKEYKKCKNEIKVQELAFESNLERFLLPLIVDDDEIAALIAEPGGVKWKDPALEQRLKGRLPKSYDLFLDTIDDIKGTVDGLKDELGISREGFQMGLTTEVDQKQPGKSRSLLRKLLHRPKQESSAGSEDRRRKKWLSRPYINIEYQTQRVKFGFGRTNRAKLFEEFTRYNARLRELLDTNDKSTALKQSRELVKNSAVRKRLWKFWRHASCLHDLLCQAWCCQCKHLHIACLFLRHETNAEHYYFRIGFLYAPSMAHEPRPWYWKEVDAQHVNDEASEAKLSFPVPPRSPNAPSKSSMRDPHPASLPSRPRVNWEHPQSPAASSSARHTTGPTVITNLCSTIATCDPTDDTLGLLKGEEDSYLLQRRGNAQSPSRAYETISLEDLLAKNSGLPLNRRQRYQIGFTLAASHLQLYPSPWLNSHWSKKDIIFKHDPRDLRLIQFDQPYILRAVSTATAPPPSPPSYASSDRCLPTLGILLIELCFGTALEDHEMRRQYHSSVGPQPATPDLAAALDLAVALEWSRSVGGEAGEAYADAVSWCLRGQAAGARDDRWREELFANVVRPLQSCCEQLEPMGREEWLKAGPVG